MTDPSGTETEPSGTETDHKDTISDPAAHPWRLIAIMVVGFFGLSAATLLLPHDPYVRYQQLAPTIHFQSVWGYERMTFDKTPIDVAIIGNSRLQSSVSGPLLQEQLSQRTGRPVHVANLSMSQEGRNAHYVTAKRLLADHPEVKLLILSVIEQMPRESHPAFRNLADTGDIIKAPVLVNRAYFTDLAFLPFRQMSLFVQTLFPKAFGLHRHFDPANYARAAVDSTHSFELPTGGRVERD